MRKTYTHDGKTLTITEWSRLLSVSVPTLLYRLQSGFAPEDVFTSKKHSTWNAMKPKPAGSKIKQRHADKDSKRAEWHRQNVEREERLRQARTHHAEIEAEGKAIVARTLAALKQKRAYERARIMALEVKEIDFGSMTPKRARKPIDHAYQPTKDGIFTAFEKGAGAGESLVYRQKTGGVSFVQESHEMGFFPNHEAMN
ncbi:hypothetical protein U0C82_18745 [Fulvimarina sp. 2208YS6-2-32]|uniref:Uncharacterized protein n=1 Tax=Fulvimarina uroteuthidis TaxID=3098149 RepID=A0ABU5I8D7_9HYPH|nr:hypothetical protein [Fulvimarina sp. 2208YS6-2-32]MDY8111159.1 hypothetical protein [Fulvimarina sp. 2208YS6-2-32]